MKSAVVVFNVGMFEITSVVVTTWGIMLILGVFCWLATRRLSISPGPLQTMLEGILLAMEESIKTVLPSHAQQLLPFIATLWIYIVMANMTGLIPQLHSPTGYLSVTAGLALLVFMSVHWFGIRSEGASRYFKHYLSPTPLLLPFHLISEVTRTVALAVRLFANIMSLELGALLVLLVAGLLVPVPLLMLHIIEALIQAYIFGMLALVYIAGAMQSQQGYEQNEEGESV
ncbi:ATP synthase F0 subcomplex A subunit [Nitrosomonas cryotolerans]|uniref:ATP synthase subunit a n=1 Tax=Nitrosomonas cryotolerans ATCC 49181 TaxID=1131553 RepID=A0A1N6HRX7_9PROT|nr:F0F1 ATP synthase subunit A [Nitrosomonas cryotolerans]SFP95599.1 ATP synthase F0 subcomplex A subunit [Nitrosomonas cryotolerans]SIO22537.1 F-type H+-transporting ATPase subunit a [Nitrosomonas cryotolerans ATCC 49181]